MDWPTGRRKVNEQVPLVCAPPTLSTCSCPPPRVAPSFFLSSFFPSLFPFFRVTQIRKSGSDTFPPKGQIILLLLSFPPSPCCRSIVRADYIRGRIRQVRYHNSGLIFQRVEFVS